MEEEEEEEPAAAAAAEEPERRPVITRAPRAAFPGLEGLLFLPFSLVQLYCNIYMRT